jgi:ribonucleoside-diphosphate reductase beta chain
MIDPRHQLRLSAVRGVWIDQSQSSWAFVSSCATSRCTWALGVDLIDQVRTETDAWTADSESEVLALVRETVELEQAYACEILGMGPEQFAEYVEFVADRRCAQLGRPKQYGTDNPFPWMSGAADLNKEKNFFETQVTEYQSGGQLEW